MNSVSSFANDDQQSPFQVVQVPPERGNEWSHSEYTGRSQLPVAVISITCGVVIVLLVTYIVYLQRARWNSMVAQGKKQVHRLTMKSPSNDPLAHRLDALEKALRRDVAAVNSPLPKVDSCDSVCKYSIHTGESSSTGYSNRPRAVSFAGSTPAIRGSVTMQGSIVSGKSFYSQSGNSFTLSGVPLPTIQIHSVETSSVSPSASFESQNRPRSVSLPPVVILSPQPKRYGQLGGPRYASTTPTFLLPQTRQPSLSSMLHEFTLESAEDFDGEEVSSNQPSELLIPPGLYGEEHMSEESLCHSSLNTPALSTPSTPSFASPSSPLLTSTFDMFNSHLENIRSSIHSEEVIKTLDDIHEDIKRSYGAFLSMMEEGFFDSPQSSPAMERLRESLYGPSVKPGGMAKDEPPGEASTHDVDGDLTEEESGEFNKRFISMLIQDLRRPTSKALEDADSSFVVGMSTPPRSQNPMMTQLEEEEDLPTFGPVTGALGLGRRRSLVISPASDWLESLASPQPAFYTTSPVRPQSYASPLQAPHGTPIFQSPNPNSPSRPSGDRVLNRYSMVLSRPVRGDLHLRKYDLEGRVMDPSAFGFGRAVKALKGRESDSPDTSLSSASCYNLRLEDKVKEGEGTINPRSPPSSKMKNAKSLPNIKKVWRGTARLWAALPPSPALFPDINLVYTIRS